MTEHTKLPWTYLPHNDPTKMIPIISEAQMDETGIFNVIGYIGHKELPNEANVRYIVHAANLFPKMLAMLEDVGFDNDGYCNCCGMLDGHWENCELEALLREARGQAK